MPRWINEPSAPQALQRRWSHYYAALKKHEDGHIQHGREFAILMKERLMGIGVVPCDQMQALAQSEYQRLYSNLKTRDQEYDARTNHGASQQAVFK
jgi:predicted secreted Zn-dependent protease